MAYKVSSTTIISDTQEIQNVGIITATEFFGKGTLPAGTVMIFTDSAAPTGWTKSTAHDNKTLRVVNGTGGGSGGNTNFTTCCADQSLSFTGNTGNVTLTTPQIASHTHSFTATPGGRTVSSGPFAANGSFGNAGGGAAHNHPISVSTPLNLAVKYIDAIICTRDA